MKSIIEQASSIMKAIEKAWDQAEKPKEFSIKVFEQEERNFFGMTTKPAKIGIFFNDVVVHEKPAPRPHTEIKECRPRPQLNPTSSKSSFAKASEDRLQRADRADNKTSPNKVTPAVERPLRIPATWNDAMVATTHNWLKQTLSLMGMPSITFNSEIAGKNLKLTFNVPLIADVMHEKQLFRSFAHLIMSSLRNQYKQEIKDLKVILIRPE